MEKQNTTNLLKHLISSFLIIFILTLIVYFFFKFEIAILFWICSWIALISTGIVWLENTIIKKK